MQLPLQNFAALMQTMAAAVQGSASQLLDLTVGSVLRAILEANASIALWLQWLIVQVLSVARAATSTGADLDSWMADFYFIRLPASFAQGEVTFSRYTPTQAAQVAVGVQVISNDGTQTFAVVADASNPNFNSVSNTYTVGAGVTSITVPVTSLVAGSAGNMQPGMVTLLGSPIYGIDTVSNSLPFAGGAAAEGDAAFRTRFALYIQSRSLATSLAIESAISGIQQNLTYVIQENVDAGGNALPGGFLVTIDDGSGDPPPSLISAAAAAVDLVRPVSSIASVRAPVIYLANVQMSLGISAGNTSSSVVSLVTNALESTINAIPVGGSLPWSRLAQIAYDASNAVTNVTAISLNGSTSDLSVPPYGVIKAGSMLVS